MQADRSYWPAWAHFLNRWGMAEMAAFLLDAAGPFAIIFAQIIRAGKPFFTSENAVPALTDLLEDRDESQQFAAYLRGEQTW